MLCAQNLKNGVWKNVRKGVKRAYRKVVRKAYSRTPRSESRLTTLLKLLKADGRLQDLELAIDDEKAREKFYQEYHIS